MFHSPECQKYRQWKRKQAKKSKGVKKTVKKKKHREPITDCIDEEDEQVQVTEASQKIDSSRCKKKRRIRPKLLIGLPVKRVSLTELLLRKIQPPVEVRERILNSRHISCLYHTALESGVATDIEEITRTSLLSHTRAKRYAPKICKEKRPVRRKPTKVRGKAKGVKRKVESGTGEESKNETLTTGKSEQKVRDQPKRKKVRRKVIKRQRDSDTESEDSECESICSFDSEVCLAGLKLRADDRKKLKELKRQSQDTNGQEKN